MRLEIELARAEFAHYSMTGRDQPPAAGETTELERNNARRLINVTSDDLIHGGLLRNDLVALAEKMAVMTQVIAGTAVRFGTEPGLDHFVTGIKELVEDCRTVINKSIQLQEWDQLPIGLAMMEVVYRGFCACLGFPYDELVRAAHAAAMKGEPLDLDGVRAILVKAGVPVPAVTPAAANDETAA